MNLVEWWRQMECVDLSVTLSPDLPVTWPGLPHFHKRVLNWFESWREPNGEVIRSAGCYYDQWLEIDEHCGTHVDFPSHILPAAELHDWEGRFGSGVPLTAFAGPAAVVNATRFLDRAPAGQSPRVRGETLETWEAANGRLQPGDILLLDTGYVDRYFAPYPEGNRFVSDVVNSGALPGWPVPSDDFFELAAERSVRHIGISSPSIGALDDALGPHRAGMLRGITFAEMLYGLGRLPARGALYVGFPLKIAAQSGSPIRAVAFKPKTLAYIRRLALRFNQKTCIVTGGASGIGEAVVHALVREGGNVVFLDVDETRGGTVYRSLCDTGRCRFIHGSVGEEACCAATVKEAEAAFGPVSVLVNNAARFIFRTVEEATAGDWREILDINVIGVSLMTRHAVESMKKAGGGAIVNVSSISGHIAQAGTMTYNATKSAILGLTRCLALDLGKHNIRVNCVSPGYVKTPAFYYYIDQSGRQRQAVERELSAQTMLGRLATPEDVASAVLFLAGPEAAYVTGADLIVDGGVTAV